MPYLGLIFLEAKFIIRCWQSVNKAVLILDNLEVNNNNVRMRRNNSKP
jgi:hypothetical protein